MPNKNDFWTYVNTKGHITIIYVVDNKRMMQGETIEYLKYKYKMSTEKAYDYIASLPSR